MDAMTIIRAASYSTDDDRYEALVRRDLAADDAFVYSVASTGVYCRPSCAARLALRKNVAFHADAAAAEAAGFRACKRCRPRDASRHARAVAIVGAARARMDASDSPLTLAELAASAGMSRFHFQRLFKATCGMTPKAYERAVRLQRVRGELADATRVTDAIYDAGYASSGRFYDDARRNFGMTPTQVRRGGADVAIHASVSSSSLGTMLVAATERGVCAILFGDDEAALRADLARRFPRARLVDAPADFASMVSKIAAYVERPHGPLALPLDLHGTAFQQRVWRELQTIAAGTTSTYATIAERIGMPTGARAVAQACATNPVAIAIPCHRVVRRDGTPSGYRWGLARKRALLDREAEG
jgi:AraC family transcriptional regulator of adaptative response/methylated-DNA-[protein]-cysteine methyltransferase